MRVKRQKRKENGRGYNLILKSLNSKKLLKGSVSNSGGIKGNTVSSLIIKKGYENRVINKFKTLFANKKWSVNQSLNNYNLPSKAIYYAYEHNHLPTTRSVYGTKIVRH